MTTDYSPSSPVSTDSDKLIVKTFEPQLEVTITYLEQTARPTRSPVANPTRPGRKIALMRTENPPVHFYRYLYDLIGKPYNWISRRKLSDENLVEIIHDERVYLYILYLNGAPIGMAEVDARGHDIHEIKFFGLAPEYIGDGLGKYFFANVLDLTWSHGPQTVKLETCTLDHPAALPFYQKFGFAVVDRRQGYVERLSGYEPPTPQNK